jgi:hypothetical protein
MGADLRPYIVRQGDTLTKLAYLRGFAAATVWAEAKNDDVRKLRPDMDLLSPGDIVYLPESKKEGLPIQKGTTNRYIAKVPKVTVHLVLQDDAGTPLAGEPYEIRGLGDLVTGTVPDDGAVSFDARVTAREATLVLTRRGLVFPVRVGDLDPVEEPSGVRMRLAHLGYLRSPGEDDPCALVTALSAFQRAQKLEVTGALDDVTRDALKSAHGS